MVGNMSAISFSTLGSAAKIVLHDEAKNSCRIYAAVGAILAFIGSLLVSCLYNTSVIQTISASHVVFLLGFVSLYIGGLYELFRIVGRICSVYREQRLNH